MIRSIYVVGFVLGLIAGLCIGFVARAADKPIEALRASTVRIDIGTGSIVEGKSGEHYLLTNWHVCNGAIWKRQLRGFYPDGQNVVGPIVKRSPAVDLCAASVGEGTPALRMGRSLAPGQDIWTRGYPEGILSETHGNVGRLDTWQFFFPIGEIGECPAEYRKEYGYDGRLVGCLANYHSTLSSLYSRPGSSGSPVVDSNGNLVGVISSFDPSNTYEAGMVPYQAVRDFLESL